MTSNDYRPRAFGATTWPPRFQRYLVPSAKAPSPRQDSSPLSTVRFEGTPNSYGTRTYGDDSGADTPVSPVSPTSSMGLSFPCSKPISTRLKRTAPELLRCRSCSVDIAYTAQIVSKGFTGRHGRAYLVAPSPTYPTPSCPAGPPSPPASLPSSSPYDISDNHRTDNDLDLPNITVGAPEPRQLATGPHTVADITCAMCQARLGWKYVDAQDVAQRYKIGKFILETAKVVSCRSWEDVEVPITSFGSTPKSARALSKSPRSPSSTTISGRRSSLHSVARYFYDPTRRRRSSAGAQQAADRRKESTVSEDCFAGAAPGPYLGDDFLHEERVEQDGEVVFDSDDEDECDEIFAGIWDATVVAKRRESRVTVRPQQVMGI